nr:unnamed protein product [Spirometra erinaceieuropaei]
MGGRQPLRPSGPVLHKKAVRDGSRDRGQSAPGKKIISKTYKALLFASILLPFVALWLIVFAAFAPDWEVVQLRVDRFLQLLCPGGGFNGAVLTLPTGTNGSRLILRQLLLLDGRQVSGGSLAEDTRLCRGLEGRVDRRKWGLDFNLSDIVGIRMGRESLERSAGLSKDTWEVYNIQAGVFKACNVVSAFPDTADKSSPASRNAATCFNYVLDAQRPREFGCRLLLMRMQNNLISCTIVVLMCVGCSVAIGVVSIAFRIVPAALVNAFLYLTAGLFVIFSNFIQQIKVDRVQSKWGPCYPIASLPEELYDPRFISVSNGWPIYVNWVTVFVFFAASCVWFIFKRLLNFETSKSII